MSGTITVSSTTDSQEAVDQAAEYGEQTLPFPEEEKPGTTSEAEEAETVADQEPAEQPENEEEEEAEEEEPESPEQARPAMGRTRREREATIARLLAKDQARDKQFAEMQKELEQLRKLQSPEPQKPDYSKRPDAADPKYRGKGMESVMYDTARHAMQEAEQEKAEQSRKQIEQKVLARRDFVLNRYEQQAAEARAKYSDFNEVVDGMGALSDTIVGTIKQQLNGAEVAYYLAKNPDLLEELKSWDSIEVDEGYSKTIATLQNIAEQLRESKGSTPAASSPTPRSPQPRPAAPRPLRHVGGASAATSAPVNPDRMSMKDYNDWRNAGGGR